MKARTDLPLVKGTVQAMSEAQENILVTDPEAEKEQNRTGIGIIIPKERELGAEKDTTKVNHGDGEKNADTAMIIIALMGQEMGERESPLIAIKTLPNGVKLTTTGHIRMTAAKADGLTRRSPERRMYLTLAATEQTYSTVQYLRSALRNILAEGMHFHRVSSVTF